MLLTNHVLSGALIGALARRPLTAFAAGVASHFVLDAVPHWGDWGSRRRFLRVAVPDGLISLAAMGALAATSPADRRLAVLAGMTGAALPDADKPATMWFGWSPFPAAVNRFHSGIQREAWHRLYVELLAAGGLTAAALIALRRSGGRSGGDPTAGPQAPQQAAAGPQAPPRAAAAYPGSGYRRPTSRARSPRVISNIGAASSSANLR